MPKTPHVPGSPDHEHLRSPAARRTAALAARNQLFFAHYEHRYALPWPEHFRPLDAEPARPASFEAGVLSEPKYGAFRHDLLIASFHPGHRAQWTAHELCHALVGFAYQPSAPKLFHALAAWLAELLPVSLWYFFDEAGLRRCPLHRGQGALFQLHCAPCEQAALEGPRPPDSESKQRTREGLAFMDRELAAIARSRRSGGCAGTRYATIDLASDALAYVRGHGRRLNAPETERWAAAYFPAGHGLHADLDALEARVLAVRDAIVHGARLTPHRARRRDYVAQDIGYRLWTVRAGLRDQRGEEVERIAEALAADRSDVGLRRTVARYTELCSERTRRGLPSPAQMFAVGYPLIDGLGSAEAQIAAGVASACPSTLTALGKQAKATSARFAREDQAERVSIGRRFATWLGATRSDGVADLARLEAAICHSARPDEATRTLPTNEARDTRRVLAAHAELVPIAHAVAACEPRYVARLPRGEARWLAVVRGADDLADIIELPFALGKALLETRTTPRPGEELGLSEHDLASLMQAGLLVPAAYTCGDLPSGPSSAQGRRKTTRRAIAESSIRGRKSS